MAEKLDLVDFEAGRRVAGQKFYYLKNEAVLLELALMQYAMHMLVRNGYTPIITPDVARVEVLEGIGFIPRPGSEQAANLQHRRHRPVPDCHGGDHARRHAPRSRFSTNQTAAEVRRLIALLPHRGRRSRPRYASGLYRVHQFTKVEMFAFCTPEQSEAIHQELLAIEE